MLTFLLHLVESVVLFFVYTVFSSVADLLMNKKRKFALLIIVGMILIGYGLGKIFWAFIGPTWAYVFIIATIIGAWSAPKVQNVGRRERMMQTVPLVIAFIISGMSFDAVPK